MLNELLANLPSFIFTLITHNNNNNNNNNFRFEKKTFNINLQTRERESVCVCVCVCVYRGTIKKCSRSTIKGRTQIRGK